MKIRRGDRAYAVTPRLLNLREAAGYLGCSYWTVRDWCLAGYLPTLSLPPLRPRPGEPAKTSLRRVLIDKRDLDAFVDARRTPGTPDVESCARRKQAGNRG